MVDSLLSSFDLVEKPIKKEQLLKTYKTVISMLEEDLLPSLTEVIKVERNPKISKSNIVEVTETVFKLKKLGNKSVFTTLEKMFLSIDKNRNKIEDLISKHTSSVLTSKVLTIKDAAIIKLVDDISSMVLFSMDLVVCALADVNKTAFPKIKFKKIKDELPGFAELVANYSKDIDKTILEVSKLDDSVLTKDSNTSMLDLKLKSNGVNFDFSKNFINNPFYHIRMWLVDRDIRKLESLKDKRRLTELRLMELKVQKLNDEDENIAGQIQYYEEKLATLDYEIEKLQEA